MDSFSLLKPPSLPKAPQLPFLTRRKKSQTPLTTTLKAKRPRAKKTPGAKKPRAPAKKRKPASRQKKGPPPFEDGEVFVGLCPQDSVKIYPQRPSLVRDTKKPPPGASVLWYRLQWKNNNLLPTPAHSSFLRVAYKEKSASIIALYEHFMMPIRWSAFDAKRDMTILDNGDGGVDYFWFNPSCIVQWSDANATAVVAIRFSIINKNWLEDYGDPLWEPVINTGKWLEKKFPGQYESLPPCHPDADIAIKLTPTDKIPQRTPPWEALREMGMDEDGNKTKRAGSTAVTKIFDFYGDQGTEVERANVVMLIGTQGEEMILCYWLTGRHRVLIQEVGWTKHPTKGMYRGSSPDALIRDPLITFDVVPQHILMKASKRGHELHDIDWALGAVEMKFSEHSDQFAAYYFPQCLNHAICTQRWYTDLGKFCTRTGKLYIWRIWRDADIEAALEQICEDRRIWKAPGNYIPEVTNGKAVSELRALWKAEANKLNAQGPDWIIEGPEARRMASAMKKEEQRWFIPTHGSRSIRGLVSESTPDTELAEIWMHGIDMTTSIENLIELKSTAAETLYPIPSRVWTGSEAQVETVSEISKVLKGIAKALMTSADYLDKTLG